MIMEKKTTPDKKAISKKEVIQMLSHTRISDWWGRGKWKNLYQHLDSASLVFFRVAFGFILLVEVYRYFAKNWIDNFFINPSFHFNYWPFHWLESLEAPLMYYFFYLMAVLSIFVMIGLFYRISMILIFLGISYIFLLEATLYLNHLYLVVLFCFLLIFIPLNRSNSLDNLIFRKGKPNSTTPAWCLWLIRFMVAVPYFFGGIAKLSPDWLRGEPMRNWLKSGMQVPESFKAFDPDFLGYFLCYSGLLLDLFIVPALLYKKTRPYAYVVILLFHLTNAFMFQIGIFPWFMIAATLLFFEPNWPRVLWNKLTKKRQWEKEWFILSSCFSAGQYGIFSATIAIAMKFVSSASTELKSVES